MNSELLKTVQSHIRKLGNKSRNSMDRDIAIHVARSQGFENPEIIMSRSDKSDADESLRVHTYVLMDPSPELWNRLITVKVDYTTWEIHSRVWKANSPHPNRVSVDAYLDATDFTDSRYI